MRGLPLKDFIIQYDVDDTTKAMSIRARGRGYFQLMTPPVALREMCLHLEAPSGALDDELGVMLDKMVIEGTRVTLYLREP